MTEQYTQTVDAAVSGRSKATQWMGIASLLLALGFVILAAFVNWYLMFCFGAFAAIGVIETHRYNLTAKEYIYSFSPKRLVIAKRDVVNRTRRVLSVLFEDAASFKKLESICEDGDIVCCPNVGDEGVCELTFNDEKGERRLLFKPDEYMFELISNVFDGAKSTMTEGEI